MNAIIRLDVPGYQIGQPVTVYFKDTMQKQGVCEELVRCRDCKHYSHGSCPHVGCLVNEDAFCSDGERKE